MIGASVYRAPQGTTSSTFTPPPLDGSLSIPQIYDFHYTHSAEHPLFIYDTPNGTNTITWKHVVRAIHTAARSVIHSVPSTAPLPNPPPVIAILAVIDQLSYFALTAGILRSGHIAFPISPRNSVSGVANLLQKTGARHLFVSADQAMQRIAASVCESVQGVEILPVPTFEDLYGAEEDEFIPLEPMQHQDVKRTAMILHSSGSTSFPKPIPISHINLLQWGSQPYFGETDICGRILSNHALPFFHAMGVVSLTWATMSGLTVSNFPPRSPPMVSTPDSVYTSAVGARSRLIFCVPTFLEEWAQIPERVEELQKFNAVLFGGAPIQKAVGDMLAEKGVPLYPFYGATELGGMSKFLPKHPPLEGWEYFQISPHANAVFQHENESPEEKISRLMFQECPSHSPAVANTGASAYDTNDLLIQHPTNATLWKIYGRADDQIMHSTGEKTNPVPMETIMNRHPMISSTVIFGRGRFQAGVLVEPTSEHSFIPTDLKALSVFRDAIWPSVEEANRFAPSHSRIFKEMILVAHPSKPFQYTPKGTPRRQIILNEYEEEIENGYAAIQESSASDLELLEGFNFDQSLAFVRQTVKKGMSAPIEDEDDFFQYGCDSLQATFIRNTILRSLRQVLPAAVTKTVLLNFVYLNPTIVRLAAYLHNLVRYTDDEAVPDQNATTMAEMAMMVKKYTTNFPQHQPSGSTSTGEVILLTGSTGGLGSYILETLILKTDICRVYVLNRRGKLSSFDRQADAFRDRGIAITLLDSPKIKFLEGDTNQFELGVGSNVYEELRTSVTCIMHIAWRVDFNVSLSSMEPLLNGTRQLVDLALSSPHPVPPRIVFASSIGVIPPDFNQCEFVPEAPLLDPAIAVGSGYPESKWVAERILACAAENTPLAPVIVRIGQLCGGRNGSWNTSEWVPSIVKSGQLLKCLPDASGCISWIPGHIAAEALVEMRQSDSPVLHLVHPNPTSWTSILSHVSSTLEVPLVPYSTWLSVLEAADLSSVSGVDPAEENPALRILDFYRSADKPLPSDDAEAFGFPRLSTTLAVQNAASLQQCTMHQLGCDDVHRWISYWNSVEFLTPSLRKEVLMSPTRIWTSIFWSKMQWVGSLWSIPTHISSLFDWLPKLRWPIFPLQPTEARTHSEA
ncbi:hypothetical protein BDQ12DRAFT_608601 [Crucibulum laeve]|uniref:Polyketide synthase-like phosphopantetheine-binding domain-containing protein n=1 Tax=Crucibulum laeve TaxID=68775 RepID=A0A5C3LX12_9AGAR|nr:hypothetical protein BDQ12DRAFT_608601 [Crucibulum laeve]